MSSSGGLISGVQVPAFYLGRNFERGNNNPAEMERKNSFVNDDPERKLSPWTNKRKYSKNYSKFANAGDDSIFNSCLFSQTEAEVTQRGEQFLKKIFTQRKNANRTKPATTESEDGDPKQIRYQTEKSFIYLPIQQIIKESKIKSCYNPKHRRASAESTKSRNKTDLYAKSIINVTVPEPPRQKNKKMHSTYYKAQSSSEVEPSAKKTSLSMSKTFRSFWKKKQGRQRLSTQGSAPNASHCRLMSELHKKISIDSNNQKGVSIEIGQIRLAQRSKQKNEEKSMHTVSLSPQKTIENEWLKPRSLMNSKSPALRCKVVRIQAIS